MSLRMQPATALLAVMQSENLTDLVATVLTKTPKWLRSDLASDDRAARERAEEALAAMICAAIENANRLCEAAC